ncbi:MAG: transcription antitermination factor NusB [Gemmatimonadota bacterium]|nr:transcription antitermination factor NusB [Gemmatimonadota bacterium]
MSRVNPRSRARSWTLQVLYAWDVAGSDAPLDAYGDTALARRRVSARYLPYVRTLLEGLARDLPAIDARIQRHLSNWRLDRLTAIDRGILRIGTLELAAGGEVPRNVAIHEAIRLAERYGTAESPRFVNGVLDAVARGLASAE